MPHIDIPLRQWIEDDAKRNAVEQKTKGLDHNMIRRKKQFLLRKVTVGLGIVELLRHARTSCSEIICNLDNFVVRVSKQAQTTGRAEQRPWNYVVGVSILSPAYSAQLIEPSFLFDIGDENVQDGLGRYLEVEINPPLPGNDSNDTGQVCGKNDCRLLGILLYELFSGMCPFPTESTGTSLVGCSSSSSFIESPSKEPQRKRSTVRYDKKKGKPCSTLQRKPYAPLQEQGFPSSICMMVQDLIDGHDVYSCLREARNDIHLLLVDPDCLLSDVGDSSSKDGSLQLNIKKGKLYGREREVNLITDAYCRVCTGKNAAFFIGGYSGSGKTMLVNSLRARVDIAGGAYVLTQKVDQMSKERPLLDVLSAFNSLCLMIREKISSHELLEIANKLMNEFESDLSVLARLLPNIKVLTPKLGESPTNKDASIEQMMSLHNVSFTLQRFMRIVSSKETPVMLFLDDLQWAGSTSLTLIQALLSDPRGSSCLFFVGSYRDNEVKQDHPILDLMSNLESSGVNCEKVCLSGLNQDDLNSMVSESLCMFPRHCKPLTNVVFEKTEGNPYFALEFLRSLVDGRLLKYSLRERRWIWDLSKIRSENITHNVLYLLYSKMSNFSDEVQVALKILSCFGIKVDETIIDYLSSSPQYSNFRDCLSQAIGERCLQKVGSEIKFVHDKVMEAAYSLIPDNDKSQFHYDLGMLLHTASIGCDLGSVIFQIVDQINHGIPSLIQPVMQVDIAELNFSAGNLAMDFSDYETADSYFKNALSLLPENSFGSNYKLSLRLFYLKAKSSYSLGNKENAYDLLKKVVDEGLCIEDKLDAYYLYVTILHSCEESDQAYITCKEVLSQLNETIPDSIDMYELLVIVKETGETLRNISDDDLMEMNELNGVLQFTLKFFSLLHSIAYWEKPEMMPFICCRMIAITLKHGLCQDSIFGLVLYAATLCQQIKITPVIQEACRIGKMGYSLMKKRFDSSEMVPKIYFCYFGFVGVHTEPLQVCSENLRKGFEVGMSSGESATNAFYNSIHLIRTALLSGENLEKLRKEADFHLEVMARLHNKLSMPYVSAYRETIVTLINKGQSTGGPEEITSNAVYANRHKETIYVNNTLQSFWLGYSTRCHHYAKKVLDMKLLGRHNKLIVLFYAALNAFRGVKNNNGGGSLYVKLRNIYKDAISALRIAAALSPLNFSNKVHLLEAELNSFERKYEYAKSSYAAAITSSCASRYVHEQGLACELAALHYKRIDQSRIALDFFRQAKECYIAWGSQLKVDSITQQMENVVLK